MHADLFVGGLSLVSSSSFSYLTYVRYSTISNI